MFLSPGGLSLSPFVAHEGAKKEEKKKEKKRQTNGHGVGVEDGKDEERKRFETSFFFFLIRIDLIEFVFSFLLS